MKKTCSRCQVEKNIREFHRNKSQPDGYVYWCRTCRKKDASVSNWANRLLCSAKGRKVECDITKEYILKLFEDQNHLCYWFGIPLIPTESFKDPQQPSLDRLDPNRGYVKGNVVLTCLAANLGRNRTNRDRFREFVEELKNGFVRRVL